MRAQKTAYELSRSQVNTPFEVVEIFWNLMAQYRKRFNTILDLGAGDCRFAQHGRYKSYEGIEIDTTKSPIAELPHKATINFGCAFDHKLSGYSACIGNPPYVRHHDLDELWRDKIAKELSLITGQSINRKCNLYVYFLFLGLLKSKSTGLVSMLVPYEWVSRPSAKPLREFIIKNDWHVDIYRFSESIFDGVLTTASISIIDKRNRDGKWSYNDLDINGNIQPLQSLTGSDKSILRYENRGNLWSMRGMSPGTQKIFTLTEGERIHFGLHHEDVLPCVTSLRNVPSELSSLTKSSFRKRFIETGDKCWLIKSHIEPISSRLKAYLESTPKQLRDTWTCTSRPLWYRYPLSPVPNLLVSTGFTKFGPKVMINSVGAYNVGSVCGVYGDSSYTWRSVREYLTRIDFEKRVVAQAKVLKKLEIRQLNSVLNAYEKGQDIHYA
jgi:hypothetical protein